MLRDNIRDRMDMISYDYKTKLHTFKFKDNFKSHLQYSEGCRCGLCKNFQSLLEDEDQKQFFEVGGKYRKILDELVEKQQKVMEAKKQQYLADRKRFESKSKKRLFNPISEPNIFKFEKLSFCEMVEKLLSGRQSILNCEVNIPEQVHFENGCPKLYLKNEKECGCILQVNKNKTLHATVHKFFITTYNERKRRALHEDDGGRLQYSKTINLSEFLLDSSQQKGNEDSLEDTFNANSGDGSALKKGPKCAKLQPKAMDSPKKLGKKSDSVLPQLYYKDMVLVRYLDKDKQEKLKVQNESEFHQDFHNIKPSDPHWCNLRSIQMVPLNKLGLGATLKFSFCPVQLEGHDLVPKDFQHDRNSKKFHELLPHMMEAIESKLLTNPVPIAFDFRQFEQPGETETQLMLRDPQAFCLKQCNKIGYYLQRLHQVELISMQAEFS